VEAPGGLKDRIVEIVDADLLEGAVGAVIDDARLSGIEPGLVVVDAETCVLRAVVRQIVITDTGETDCIFRVFADVIVREPRDDTGSKPKREAPVRTFSSAPPTRFSKGSPRTRRSSFTGERRRRTSPRARRSNSFFISVITFHCCMKNKTYPMIPVYNIFDENGGVFANL
jgi:hypothetical protein